MKRRRALSGLGLLAAGSLVGGPTLGAMDPRQNSRQVSASQVKQSVAYWTYGFMGLRRLCKVAKELGLGAIDLVGPEDWHILKEEGMECSMCYPSGTVSLTQGWNRTQYHSKLLEAFRDSLPYMAKAGYSNTICFSGNREGMAEEEGLDNCVLGLSKILPLAEKLGITLHLELFNSKIDHPDYMADRSAWGIELCKRLDSPNFKLLYDIYHMQIAEGDIIRTIRDNHAWIGHYHTAGVPGRGEIGQGQELNYSAIAKAIEETGFTGYLAHEFLSQQEEEAAKIHALREAIRICQTK
jgi:hydroxypyruvate isomerase